MAGLRAVFILRCKMRMVILLIIIEKNTLTAIWEKKNQIMM